MLHSSLEVLCATAQDSRDMLIPAAAIWRNDACCLHSVTPNPSFPIACYPYLSADESSIHLRQPAMVCLCVFVCAHRGSCCASIFTANISDKPNESRENRYLPALSCSVLSSLFSHSVCSLLFSSLPLPPPCCLSA